MLEVVCVAIQLSLLREGAAEDAKALFGGTQNPKGQGERWTGFCGQLQSQVLLFSFQWGHISVERSRDEPAKEEVIVPTHRSC